MSIFDKTKPVAGLFSNDADVERVIEQLQTKGYGLEDEESLVIIDKAWIEAEISTGPRGFANPAGHGSPGSVALVPQPFDPNLRSEPPPTQGWIKAFKTAIMDVGIDDETAELFARRVTEGRKVVVVQVAEKEVEEIRRLFEEIGQARTTTED